MSLTQMTLSGGALILFIVVVRALALHRLPKTAFLVLWEMAALRLLLPLSIPLPFDVPVPVGRLPGVGEYLTGSMSTAMPSGTLPSESMAPHAVLPVLWLIGTVLMAAYFVVFYVRGVRSFQASLPDDSPAVREWLAAQRLCRPLEVRQSDRTASPLTYGVLRPVILLPKELDRGDEKTLTYILTHELVHVRRFDAAAKLLLAAALCAHWFNPLAWVMYILANRDLELSCDERVMDILGGREKSAYALTLINMEETRSRSFFPCNHFSRLAIEERIEAIMKYKKTSLLAAALAVVLVTGAATAFTASAAEVPEQDGGPLEGIVWDYQWIGRDLSVADGMVKLEPVYIEDDADSVSVLAAMGEGHIFLDGVEYMIVDGVQYPVSEMKCELVAVKHSDESRFTPEEWAEILEKIDRGEIRWQD